MDVQTPSIMICTPCKDGRVDINYALSLTASCQILTGAGVSHKISAASTSSIDNCRSVLAGIFLKSDCTHLLFIDDDMAWASDLPLRLINENVDIVGVPYRKKKEALEYTVRHPPLVASLEDRPWMVMVDAIGMGMTLVKRSVFEKLSDLVPEYYVGDNEQEDIPYRLFFRHEIVVDKDGKPKYESEDFHFCRLAAMAGIEIFAYVDEDVPHIGRKAFCGAFNERIGVGIDHGFTTPRVRNYAQLSAIEK